MSKIKGKKPHKFSHDEICNFDLKKPKQQNLNKQQKTPTTEQMKWPEPSDTEVQNIPFCNFSSPKHKTDQITVHLRVS